MRLISSTGKAASDIITIDMTREQFSQLISVVAVAQSAVTEFGTSCFEVDSVVNIVNFYKVFKDVKAVRTP